MTEDKQPEEDLGQKAEEIVRDGEQITEKISELILSSLRQSGEGISKLGETAQKVLNAAVEEVNTSVPEDPESTLREVYTGVTEATEKAASSMKLTFEEAKAKSEKFTEEEVKKVVSELSALEGLLFETFESVAKNARTELTDTIGKISGHIKNAVNDIKPSIEAALNAAKDHPADLFKESAGTAAGLTRNIASNYLSALASVLDSAAEGLRKTAGEQEKKED